ncbi:MAG: hypothetical protein ACRBM6_27515 [Geminicoccales bacterium]
MQHRFLVPALAVSMLAMMASTVTVSAQDAVDAEQMTFFVTSVGKGNGADLGGLEGADAHCGALAQAAGSTRTSWKAYLSSTMVIDRSGGRPFKITPGVNARDRIGAGPWHNAKGVMIAKDIDDLHGPGNNINLETGLNEQGEPIKGRGEDPNQHDILTGSDPMGMYSTAGGDTTCGNWTNSGEGSAIVGHHDRAGLNDAWNMVSWNSAHGSRGCGEEDLPKSGGAGLFYCFAAE